MNKLAIVGASKLTRNNAPFDDKSFDIWGIHKHMKAPWMKRCDAGIEIHSEDKIRSHRTKKQNAEYLEWLHKTDMLIYALHFKLKNSKPYPLKAIKKDLLGNIRQHGKPIQNFNSSIDFALALAIHLKYKEIEVYGVELSSKGEFLYQRPGFAFWVALAGGRGVWVDVKCADGQFDKNLYEGL